MIIEIYRFGRFINSVESKEELRQWILDNVPYPTEEGIIPITTNLNRAMDIAESNKYTFKMDTGKGNRNKH